MSDEYTCDYSGCGAPPFFSGRELGGHRKTHNLGKRTDTPACFTDAAEWHSAISRLRMEHPNMSVITPTFALSESCAVCPVEFMREMQSRGRCHPPANAIPQRDLDFSEEDE